MIDFLNLGSDEKSTLAGSEFQTLTIRSVQKFRRFRFPHCALYNLYGCPRKKFTFAISSPDEFLS